MIKDRDVKTKIIQLYTNRSLSFHQLNENENARIDADYVLKYLDAKNTKALFRKAVALKN
jgi:hypothetical protein